MPGRWTENRDMITLVFTPVFERSFHGLGRDRLQCCELSDGRTGSPNGENVRIQNGVRAEIASYLTMVNDRLDKVTLLTAVIEDDEAFQLGSMFTEALIKFRWDRRTKQGAKTFGARC